MRGDGKLLCALY